MSLPNRPARKVRRHRHRAAVRPTLTRALLDCGIGYSLLYIIDNDVIAAGRYPGYSRTSQVISELSAKGSPAKRFLTATVPLSTALMVAFGIGVARSANGRAALRVTGGLLVGGGLMQAMWLPFPMSSRQELAEGHGAGNDVGHLVMSAATGALVLSQMATGAMTLGKAFRVYTALSAATFAGFAALTGVESQKLSRGEPTPRLGLVERAMLGAWLLWMAVLAIVLRRSW